MHKYIACFLGLWSSLLSALPLDRVVAVVNDGVITHSELSKEVETYRQQMTLQKKELPPEATVRKQVLQHLIDVNLDLQLAKLHNITIDTKELEETIADVAEKNNLTLAQLQTAVEQQGLSWEAYRDNVRKELLIGRLQQKAVGKEAMVTPEQVEAYLKTGVQDNKAEWTYNVQNILIPLPEEPTSAKLQQAAQKAKELLLKIKQGNNFMNLAIAESTDDFILESHDLGMLHLAELPEIFAKALLTMKVGQVSQPLRTGNGYQLIKLVAIAGDDIKHQVTKTHVRHILLKPAASMTAAEASIQIKNLYQQLLSGKNFAQMAKQHSLDAVSAAKGGDLGWVNPGELTPEFEKAMNALPLHQVSKPTKTLFGWHLIEVLERKTVDDSEAYQHQRAREFLQQKKFMEALQTWQQHMRTMAYIKIMDKDLA